MLAVTIMHRNGWRGWRLLHLVLTLALGMLVSVV